MKTLTMQEYMHELYTDGVIEDYALTGLGLSTAEVTRFDGRTLVIDFGYETIHDSLTENHRMCYGLNFLPGIADTKVTCLAKTAAF